MFKKFGAIVKYVLPYWSKALWSVLSNLIAAVFSVVSFTMVIPFLGVLFSDQSFETNSLPFKFNIDTFQHNFNYYLGKLTAEYGQMGALVFIICVVLISVVLKNIFLYSGKSKTIHIRTNVVKDIRNKLMNKIFDFDLSYFSNEKRGDIISKVIVDVKEIESSIVSSFEMIFKDPILIGVYLYVLFIMSAKLTLIVLIIFPLSAFIIGQIGKTLKQTTLKGQKKMGILMGMLDEILSGIKIIKAFGAEKLVESRFKTKNDLYTSSIENSWRKRSLSGPVSDIIGTVSILLVMFFGGKLVLNSETVMSPKVFIAYLAVFTQVIGHARSFTGGYYNILKGLASVERINTILNHKYKITEISDAINIKAFKNKIEFKNVGFSYETEDKHVLNNINIVIHKGQTVALVGQSGSGKSTIVDLIPRFFDPVNGEILLDRENIKNYSINSLRSLFGYVNQQPVLFNDTIYNNILFGKPDSSIEEVEQAAKLAFAHDFIVERENGYQTKLGEGGDNLSLGEKQRISIARAILKNPPVLILDEATSALDYNSEIIVREAIQNLMKNRTTLVIAHRLSTVKSADTIYVIKDGEIIEEGNHKELIDINGYYTKLYKLEVF
jgi:ATP-binding cassette, subfamily B, bacterial MsbA